MRNMKIDPGVNWKSLDLKYTHDHNVKFDNNQVTSKDNIQLNLSDTLTNSVDFANNNYTNMIMSDVVRASELLTVDLKHSRFPEQFTTSMILDCFPTITAASKYIKILPRADDTTTRDLVFGNTTIDGVVHNSFYYQQDEINDNSLYMNVTLIDRENLTVNHNDNFANVYMTLSQNNEITFETRENDTPTSDQIFKYIINNKTGTILIMKEIDGVVRYLGSDGNNLVMLDISTTQKSYPSGSMIKIVSYEKTSSQLTLTNNWVSYRATGDQNNLNVNSNRSEHDVYNNYLFSNQYCTITGDEMNLDMMLLKNQVTPNYTSTRNSAFPNFPDCDHREYDKIFTGTNQILGSDSMHLGYNSYTTDINIPVDSIHYFHTPQIMYPYDKININDSGLIEAGAIGGDSPVLSDKLFKKAADYKYNSPHGAPTDEETGVWLCTWLRSGIESPWDENEKYTVDAVVIYNKKVYRCLAENTNTRPSTSKIKWKEAPELEPVWVDRYYNPEKYSLIEAMETADQYVKYISKFDYITNTLSAEDLYVFDKQSDMIFEPGSLYAYYRIGPKETNTIINTLQSTLVHEGQSPAYSSSRSIINNPTKHITFTGDQYVETSTLANTKDGDCTISFNLGTDDWTKPFAGQVIGNYTNEGVGFFNKTHTTPYIIVPGSNTTDIFNTDFDLVLSLPVTASHVAHGIGNENVHLVNEYDGQLQVQQYDMKGLLVETTPLNNITAPVQSINIDHESVYILDQERSIYKYDIGNELQDQLFKPYPGNIGRTSTISSNNFVDQHESRTYIINCDTYTIDMSGNVWFQKDNTIQKQVPSLQLGRNATYTNTINGVFVSLMAEESVDGIDGNNITLTGDNINTLKSLVTEWNTSNPGNKVQIISGDDSLSLVLSSNDTIQLTGGVNAGSAVEYTALSGATDVHIHNIKSDIDDNIWVLTSKNDQSHIYKLDNDRNTIISASLSAIDNTLQYSMSGNMYMDLISEFRGGEYINNVVIINQDIDDKTKLKYTKLDLDGNLVETQLKTVNCLSNTNIQTLHNLTNFETAKRLSGETVNTNYLTVKMRLSNYFDTDRTYTELIKSDVTRLSKGMHHFVFSYNGTNGNISVFIDGNLRHAITSRDIYTGSGFKFSKTIHNPLIIGTEPFFDNVLMYDHVNIDNYSFVSGCVVDNLRVYNTAHNFHKIKALAREGKTIQPIILSLPTGKRSYIDEVKRTYKHRKPGRRATDFNIDVVTESISGSDLIDDITYTIYQDVSSTLPVNSCINKINWITQ